MAEYGRTRRGGQRRCLLDSHNERVLPGLRAIATGEEDFLHVPDLVLHNLNLALKGFASIARSLIAASFVNGCPRPPPDTLNARLNLASIDSKESSAIRKVAVAR